MVSECAVVGVSIRRNDITLHICFGKIVGRLELVFGVLGGRVY